MKKALHLPRVVLTREDFNARTAALRCPQGAALEAAVLAIEIDRGNLAAADDITKLLLRNLPRTNDALARCVAGKYLALLPQCHALGARVVAERLRQAVSERSNGTVSIGIAVTPDFGSAEPARLIEAAQLASLRAARWGGDRVMFAPLWDALAATS